MLLLLPAPVRERERRRDDRHIYAEDDDAGHEIKVETAQAYFSGCAELLNADLYGFSDTAGNYRFLFENCTKLTKVIIPASVKSIEADAFAGCTKLVCTVSEGSYAKKFCQENNISFVLAE